MRCIARGLIVVVLEARLALCARQITVGLKSGYFYLGPTTKNNDNLYYVNYWISANPKDCSASPPFTAVNKAPGRKSKLQCDAIIDRRRKTGRFHFLEARLRLVQVWCFCDWLLCREGISVSNAPSVSRTGWPATRRKTPNASSSSMNAQRLFLKDFRA